MIVSTFSLSDKDGQERFFEESFLLADIKLDTVLRMPFLTMSNANIDFQARNLQWRFYNTGDVFSTIKRVELIEKKEFAAATLDPEYKTFVVHVVHPLKKVQIAHLKVDKAPTEVLSKYADFAEFFSPKLAAELPEYGINNHAIELVDN